MPPTPDRADVRGNVYDAYQAGGSLDQVVDRITDYIGELTGAPWALGATPAPVDPGTPASPGDSGSTERDAVRSHILDLMNAHGVADNGLSDTITDYVADLLQREWTTVAELAPPAPAPSPVDAAPVTEAAAT